MKLLTDSKGAQNKSDSVEKLNVPNLTNSHNAPNESKDHAVAVVDKRKHSILEKGGGSMIFDGKKISDDKIIGGMVGLKNA